MNKSYGLDSHLWHTAEDQFEEFLNPFMPNPSNPPPPGYSGVSEADETTHIP